MGGRAAAMRSCSGNLWWGGPQLTRCWCHQPALGADRGGVPRSALLCGGHVTVHAQTHYWEWALHGGFQARRAAQSFGHAAATVNGSTITGPANCTFCGGGGAE